MMICNNFSKTQEQSELDTAKSNKLGKKEQTKLKNSTQKIFKGQLKSKNKQKM